MTDLRVKRDAALIGLLKRKKNPNESATQIFSLL